ncbi:MAG: response regulator transcription factor [Firmicutes bacterium]|nr:response regulator transcription factor [Bacillota bacterium]
MFRIMIVEDDEQLASIITGELERYGYEAQRVTDFAQVKLEFLRLQPHLVIMDINLPLYDGFYWCRQLRTVSTVPIIFLSARTGDMDQVLAIENGGDDYITKPFSLEVLRAKIRGALRRTYGEYALPSDRQPTLWEVNGLIFDEERNTVSWGDRQTELSLTEFRLLKCLARKAGCIVTREELLTALWDDINFVDDNTLTVNVARVRRRLQDIGLTGVIETKRGQGYALMLGETGEG